MGEELVGCTFLGPDSTSGSSSEPLPAGSPWTAGFAQFSRSTREGPEWAGMMRARPCWIIFLVILL